jgi:predicted nucleic acid-binding protein
LKLILDSDVLVLALHKPRYEYLIENHHKAVNLFKSCIEGTNSFYLPTTVAIEVPIVLVRATNKKYATNALKKLYATAVEIYPFSSDDITSLFSASTSGIYFSLCHDNALNLAKIKKDDQDSVVPGFKKDLTEVKIGGMDIFVLTYAQLKNAILITNDWSLWYASWKSGVKSYWLSGLSENQQEKISNGEIVEYP